MDRRKIIPSFELLLRILIQNIIHGLVYLLTTILHIFSLLRLDLLYLPRTWLGLGEGNTIGPIPVSPSSSHGPGGSRPLPVRNKSQPCHEVNKKLGRVELARNTKLASSVIKRVLVVPVVPSLSNCAEAHKRILTWVGEDIIRMVTVQMSCTVHEPSKM